MTIHEAVRLDRESLGRMLAEHASVEAAALYGSFARGDIEEHSDIDLLLVCRSSRKLPTYMKIRETLGGCFSKLSITVYTEQELQFLYSAKSLFLLHLSLEAAVLLDRTGFLNALLTDFHPKDSYAQDFERSLSLIDPLRTIPTNTPNNLHRLSYIYSLFRVFGVYLLAESRTYEFSKTRMTQLLADKFPDRSDSVELLATLRVLNSNFFTGGPPSDFSDSHSASLPRYTSALASLANVTLSVDSTPYADAIRKFDEAVGDRTRTLDYRLRMWFLLLVYDGLNFYCSKLGTTPLNAFSESALRPLMNRTCPKPVRAAAEEAILYLHRYPLKYFLSQETRIDAQNAREILRQLSKESS